MVLFQLYQVHHKVFNIFRSTYLTVFERRTDLATQAGGIDDHIPVPWGNASSRVSQSHGQRKEGYNCREDNLKHMYLRRTVHKLMASFGTFRMTAGDFTRCLTGRAILLFVTRCPAAMATGLIGTATDLSAGAMIHFKDLTISPPYAGMTVFLHE